MSIKRPWLLPLVPLYAWGLRLKEKNFERPRRLQCPVISIGSLSAGGAGKTPMTLLLIELLQRRGLTPVVLSRGYRREGKGIARVEGNGDPAEFGDEPVLIAQRAGVPVYVGKDRYQAGLLAQEFKDEHTIFLLDDGFQHRGLARDADIVLLTEADAEDALLPAGNLREPWSALRRADVIVLREDEAALLEHRLAKWTDASHSPLVWKLRRRLRFEGAPPQRPLVFCGIARPQGLMQMLRATGCEPAELVAFADHHSYREDDLNRLIERAQRSQAGVFVTTEKDAVKLNAAMRARLESVLPLVVLRLELELVDADAAVDGLLARVQARRT